MNKFENLNDALFQKIEINEMSNIKGGDRLWHTWLTGRTKTTTATGIAYHDKTGTDEQGRYIENIDFNDPY